MNAKVVIVAVAVALGWLADPVPHPVLAGESPVATAPAAVNPSDADSKVAMVERRQREIRRMSAAMRVIGLFLKGGGATVADVGASAETIRVIAAAMTPALFPEGTAVGVGRSGARPEVWQQWDIFRERASTLASAAGRLAAAAKTGDPEAVRAPITAVGQACIACHEMFRLKKP